MELNVLNIEGKETGRKINLTEDIFGIEPNDHAIYLDVRQYMANQRQGTHKSKERAEVSGTTKKLKRQKGTGTARMGSAKSPVFRGGGRVFGPRPRNYSFKLNKKLKSLARLSALSYKAKDNAILVVEDFKFDKPKTKDLLGITTNLNLLNKKSLFVVAEQNNNVYLSSRNLKGINVIKASDLNTYSILDAKNLVLFESAVKVLEERYNQNQ
jgi:large subunit ribosomal protein L4